MKKLLTAFGCFLSVVLLQALAFIVLWASPLAMAADLPNGARVFQNNCAMCHVGGKNVVVPDKTLDQAALEKYGKNSVEAITVQVKAGMNAMPAFKGKLTDAQIEDVATYVLKQAENGW